MGFSLRKGYGLDNKSLSGDFASKMWASYTQLNPGVYSEAIATEFKRRMKPDYVDSAGVGYYYNTFGPSGLNKTTADWIYLLTTSGNIVSRTIAKSGNLLKWNLDGTVVTQNSLPAYTKGTNAGIITMTSTDGWSGVTIFYLSANSFTNTCPTFNFPNVTTFNIQGSNFFSGNVPNWIMPKVTVCYFNANLFSGIVPNHNFPLITSYYSSANAGITGFAGNLVVTNNMSTEVSNTMMIPTSGVNARLKAYNDMFAITPPIKNLTLNLSGATMGIPTGAGSNADLLGILAKFTAAGFTATIVVRTV